MTQRPLVVYFATAAAEAQIDNRDLAYFAELLADAGGKPFDLMLETPGGFTDPTELLVSYLRSCNKDFRVIVPRAAKSNGTVLCLASRAIVMGDTSELGPIDPSLQGVPSSILSEPAFAAINFVLHHAGKHVFQQTKKLATHVLSTGMLAGRPANEIDEIVAKLATRQHYFSHGSAIDREEAAALGLTVEYLGPQDDLWRRFWWLRSMYDFDCRRGALLKVFEGRRVSAAIAAPPPVTTP